MSTAHHNLSSFDSHALPSAKGMKAGIVVSEWNSGVTHALLEGALVFLQQHGVEEQDLVVTKVPGSFELPFGAQLLAEHSEVEAIICLGCVIQGETRHFDFVSQGVTEGVMRVSLDYHLPVIFGVLTTDTEAQALDRAGGRYGNKGTEAAVTAIRMIAFQRLLSGGQNTPLSE
ncbi:MAG: 6,7-dimethyl-8-ribityllumazine synthase [Bacteroidales bacterium]|nr:6,7-dimethyl-8-ribityllumazine synthase [Bacteroidales bacterium]